jgi:hypothetical protein
MQRINSDIVSVIVDFLPQEEINQHIDGLYKLDSSWRIVMHWNIQKQKIYKYFDLGRDYNTKFSPFSQATFEEIITIGDKLGLIKELFDWIYKITRKKFVLNNESKLFLNDPIIDAKQPELINEGWCNFFRDARKYIYNIPLGFIIDEPVAEIKNLFNTEKELKTPENILALKQRMASSWVPVYDDRHEEQIVESYNFVPEIWFVLEQMIAFLEKRSVRHIPYTEFDYIATEDFNPSKMIEGMVDDDAIIFNTNPFDEDEH